MEWLNLLIGGAGGGILGAIGGIAEKQLTGRLELKRKRVEYEHIEAMQDKQHEYLSLQHANELESEVTKGEYAGLTESLKHDATFKFVPVDGLIDKMPKLAGFILLLQALVNAVRALFRPGLTLYIVCLAVQHDSPELMGLSSAAVLWWVGSRGSASGERKL